MKRTDVLVIGSSAAGLVASTTGKRVYPNKSFTVITMMDRTLIPCGIPYIFGSVGAGFIGVEISDELNKAGKEVVLMKIYQNGLRRSSFQGVWK